MAAFNMQKTVPHFLESPGTSSSRTSSVSAETVVSNYFSDNNTSQADWSHNLALAGIAFGLGDDPYSDGSMLDVGGNSFDAVAYDDAVYAQDISHIDTHKAVRQARRKAQNRAAQRKFRERKDCQLKALETEIAELRLQIEGSRCKITNLQDALTEAKTQVETLKSILPSIARSSISASRPALGSKQGQQDGNAVLTALFDLFFQGSFEEDSRIRSIPTPKSSHGEETLYS